jgi:hypothetical protein
VYKWLYFGDCCEQDGRRLWLIVVPSLARRSRLPSLRSALRGLDTAALGDALARVAFAANRCLRSYRVPAWLWYVAST